MRRLIPLGVFAAAVAACASPGSLPGGPPDALPPRVVTTSPESGAVNFTGRAVTIRFDETVNDRGTGATALEALILISPRDGEPRVAYDRDRIAVRPRSGWRPNTAYSITIAPGIADLRGNISRARRTVVFSTGPAIPAGVVAGRAFDWATARVVANGWVEAVRLADSAVFTGATDSTGAFAVGPLDPGDYVVRGYVDQNANRVRDRTESWDSVAVRIADAPRAGLELLLAPRDTVPARLAGVTVIDSVTLELEFDKALDPTQAFAVGMVRVVRADSTPSTVTALRTRAAFDSAVAAARAAAAPRRDSAAAAPAAPPAAPPAARAAARRDTTPPPPTPSRPAPPTKLVANVAPPLAPGTTYRVTVTEVRTLLGRTGVASRLITTARAAAAASDTPAARDTTARDTTARDTTARPATPPAAPPGR